MIFVADGNPVMENPEVILLDKDGTLIDIHHYWTSMIRMRANMICRRWFCSVPKSSMVEAILVDAMGVNIETGRMKPEGPVGIKPRPFIVNVAAECVRVEGPQVSNEDMEELFREVDLLTEKDMRSLVRPLPGVEAFLSRARELNLDLAVVTTDVTRRAEQALSAVGLMDYFRFVIGADTVRHTKPAPDLADYVLRTGGYDCSKAVVIGDHPVDIGMGVNAGITCNVGVLSGISTSKAFENLDCIVVNDFTQLCLEN